MSRIEPEDLERRLAARVGPALPPGLRERVLADVDRTLEQPERAPVRFLSYALPVAAALLVCANLFQSLFLASSHHTWDQALTNPEAEPLARSLHLPPGVSEREVQQLSFLLRANSRSTRPTAPSAQILSHLLHEDSLEWTKH